MIINIRRPNIALSRLKESGSLLPMDQVGRSIDPIAAIVAGRIKVIAPLVSDHIRVSRTNFDEQW